jgi:hypothetical protein
VLLVDRRVGRWLVEREPERQPVVIAAATAWSTFARASSERARLPLRAEETELSATPARWAIWAMVAGSRV